MSYAKYLPYLCNANPLGRITRKFGAQGHTGVDSITFAGATDWSVCAVCPAKVEKVYTSEAVGNVVQYGYDSVKGRVTLAYYHLGKTLATAGQNVELGTKIGVMGDTGSLCRGVHLHVSMWIGGNLVDPEAYLAGKKAFPAVKAETTEGGNLMIKKVNTAVGLWLRKAAPSGDKVVLMPVGTTLICGKTKTINGKTWAQTAATIAGKQYTGWCCISGYTSDI